MEWSPEQARALDAVNAWLNFSEEPVFRLYGYAGTGKTTLARHFAEGVSGRVYFAAFTGKAAYVLTQKGCEASTIHKLIYVPKDRSKARLLDLQLKRSKLMQLDPVPKDQVLAVEMEIEAERRNAARPMFTLNLDSPLRHAKLVVVDECSMIDTQMGEDLLSFGCKVLALGDPGQLPPVQGKSYFGTRADFQLTEIHRQARDNPIIQLATDARLGRPLRLGRHGDSLVVDRDSITREDLAVHARSAGQVLVGRNETRLGVNRRLRQIHGRDFALPVANDKLVCLRNNHEEGLLNGQLFSVARDATMVGDYVELNVVGEEGDQHEVLAHLDYFEGRKPEHYSVRDADCFDYGYALTVHKAQGSQWDDVLLMDEWNRADRKEWLYTAITRAAKRLTVVKM